MSKLSISTRFSAAFLACCFSACTPPADPSDGGNGSSNSARQDAGPDQTVRPSLRFRAATFNVGRFFDTVCDSGNCDDSNDFERQLSPAEFAFKAEQIAGGIESLDADAIMLQELETEECLQALVERLPEYDVTAFGEIGGNASLDVAFLARDFDHVETRTHRADTELPLPDGRTQRFARELLEVHVDADGQRLVFFSAHFKAKRNDDPEWRLAEAEGARAIAEATNDELPDAFVLLGGDLNDEPGSPPLTALTERGGLRLVTRDEMPDEMWTYAYFGDQLAIDHLMYVPTGAGSHVDGSPAVVRDTSGTLGGSDHAALASDFQVWLD